MLVTKKILSVGLLALMTTGVVNAAELKIEQVNKNNPLNLADYRLDYAEMRDIANSSRLAHRVFYIPSVGADAAWFDAVKKGNLAQVKKMVAAGQNIEAKDTGSREQTALGWAAFIGYEDIVDYLIGKGANLYATDKSDVYNVLKSAVLGKNVNIVKKVYPLVIGSMKDGVNMIESDGETLLMVAASNNRVDTVKYLLAQGAKIDHVGKPLDQSHNALTYACSRSPDLEVVKVLLDAGAVNFKTGKPAC
ncbi:ankyrin repeat domain-containing protein [Aeromonas cavernicola]|uniref:Uncharacterized protein n=1 Tax=Aeromonas cavernicola TaxID=1006623 RepID=A0A2H9U7P4_9GAMM|nr:ankyrin repeat domain-containing protein [Aeromonas cavernicola]PJG60067.1 hypothetical protein CUC53_03985 [Aeromonas cavernicola]